MKKVPLTEVKNDLSKYLRLAEREEVIITRNGRAAAVLLNVDEYERLKATLEVLSDPELMRQIRQSEKFYASGGKGLSFEEVFGDPPTVRRPRGRR